MGTRDQLEYEVDGEQRVGAETECHTSATGLTFLKFA